MTLRMVSKEEMQEIVLSVGFEYQFQKVLAARMGYFHENKWEGKPQVFNLWYRYQLPGHSTGFFLFGTHNF